MKQVMAILVILLFAVSCAPRTTITQTDTLSSLRDYNREVYTGPKWKIAVARFENNTPFAKRRLGDHISDALITELAQTGRFLVLERQEVDRIIEQYRLSLSGLTEGTLQDLELLDADYLVIGSVTHYSVTTTGSSDPFSQSKVQQAKVVVDIRLVDLRDGEVVFSESGEGLARKEYKKVLGFGSAGGYDESLEQEAFRVAVISLVGKLIQAVSGRPWRCDVVRIEANMAYINAGRKSHLKPGMKLEIRKQGEAVTGPDGKILGYKSEKMGTGTVREYFGENGAIVILDTPLIFEKGLYAVLMKEE